MIMVEAAFRIRPTNAPELYAFLLRLAPVSGKKRSRIALARKMLCILWHMAKTKTPYDKSKIIVPFHIDPSKGIEPVVIGENSAPQETN
jgi:hypothetical protein